MKSKNKLGCALQKKFNSNHNIKNKQTEAVHPKAVNDDKSNTNKYISQPEESPIDAVIYKIEADENRSFQAERRNVSIFDPTMIGIISEEEKIIIEKALNNNASSLQVPRRPKWDESMDAEELDRAEHLSFNSWRRILNAVSKKPGIQMTPYEKNLEIWRQLWRVVERSDLLVQIVDARDPLLYLCVDLKKFTQELSPLKKHLILVNKSDFLTTEQKEEWITYFMNNDLSVAFFSALQDINNLTPELEDSPDESKENINEKYVNSSRTLNRLELIELFESFKHSEQNNKYLTVGLVGYPNVGKSSTINCLLQGKKVAVSATPGKTKHFQTLYLSEDLMLCDCPGLIFPAFVSSKEEMIISGILPIDQMKEYVGPINQIINKIPRHVLEKTYGLSLPDRVTTENLLNTFGCIRGYMSPGGMPDRPKSARCILKDYVKGQLLYCKAPNGHNQERYFSPIAIKERKINQMPVERVLIKNEEPELSTQSEAVIVNGTKQSTGAIPKVEHKWWREEIKQKRITNRHKKTRKMVTNTFIG